VIGREGPGPERPGPDYPPEWDTDPEDDRSPEEATEAAMRPEEEPATFADPWAQGPMPPPPF
jgi:hypothetical protein